MKKRKELNPLEVVPPFVKNAKKVAGGADAVMSSMKHIAREVGLLKGPQTLMRMNQKQGFDCPGCAWPDPQQRSTFEFCENGAKAVAEEATKLRADAKFFKTYSVEVLSQLSDYELGKSGRILEPMYLSNEGTHYRNISWDQAFDLIAKKINACDDPNQAVFYTSGRTSNEAAYLYQLMVRLFGTNNLPDCSNMCHESSGIALNEVIGIGKGTVTLEDFNHADCIFVIGQNPGTNHPRMLRALQGAHRNGCKIVSINPLKEAGLVAFQNPQEVSGWLTSGTKLTDLYLQVKIAGDIPLLKGIMKVMLESREQFDTDFIAKKTIGFEELVQDIEQTSWDEILTHSGVARIDIEEAANIALNSKKMIWCWAMGMTQHKDSVGAIQQIINILLLGGHFGRVGAGACPVRGHSNVQGDRTMGIWEKPKAEFLDRLEMFYKKPMPREPGLDVVHSIEAMLENKIKVLFCMGGNFLSATPDTLLTAKAIESLDMTVHVSTKLNRSHLVTGKEALILPCLGRTEVDRQSSGEQFVTIENSMGFVHPSRGHLTPASPYLKSEVSIVCELAKRLFPNMDIDWDRYQSEYRVIREDISHVIAGFENYNSKLTNGDGFYLPNSVKDDCGFNTSQNKAKFTVYPLPKVELDKNQFIMMTIRTHDQYNTTIYGLEDRYRGINHGRRAVLINLKDMLDQKFIEGDKVTLKSHFNGKTITAKGFYIVPYDIPRQCVATFFPEANVLVPLKSMAIKSHTPTSKSVIVSIEHEA